MTINSNFTLNLYNDLKNEHSASMTINQGLPYFLGPKSFNLRLRSTALSASIGQQSSLNSEFDYGRTQRKKEEEHEDQEQSSSL